MSREEVEQKLQVSIAQIHALVRSAVYMLVRNHELFVDATNTRLPVIISVLVPHVLTRETLASAFWVRSWWPKKMWYRILRSNQCC